jgi:hypothetical protein
VTVWAGFTVYIYEGDQIISHIKGL